MIDCSVNGTPEGSDPYPQVMAGTPPSNRIARSARRQGLARRLLTELEQNSSQIQGFIQRLERTGALDAVDTPTLGAGALSGA